MKPAFSFTFLQKFREEHPLRFVLLVALFLRILAGFFSKGFAIFDDHYCVIEQAQDWIYGFKHDLNKHDPPMHPVLYSGLHYYLFILLGKWNVHSPEVKMTINRLIHSIYSVLIVYYGYRITEILSDKKNALMAGLILATLWFMPFLCSKDLVEIVCIPFCMASFYYILKIQKGEAEIYKNWVFAGGLFGLAFAFRIHTILFAAGVGLIFLWNKQWVGILLFSISYFVIAAATQGMIDAYFFEYPFHSLVAYFKYNSVNGYNYTTGPFYQYVLTILGFLIPPVSIFLIYGFIRARKVAPALFSAGLLFFLFHSYFPNKQERFILPFLPIIIILGVIGWNDFMQTRTMKEKYLNAIKYSWIFFWTINLVVCFLLIFTYSKKSKIEPLVYLSRIPNLSGIILETSENSVYPPPVFYLGRFASTYEYYKERIPEMEKLEEEGRLHRESCIILYSLPEGKKLEQVQMEIEDVKRFPQFVIFSGSDRLQVRIERVKIKYPTLTFEKKISPAFYDQVLHFLNPAVHKDQHVVIYKI